MVESEIQSHTQSDTAETRPPRRRRRTLAVVAVVAVLAVVAVQVAGLLPGWGNPFAPRVVDRSPAPLLLALEDVADYRAATGTFQVLVDLERDIPNVPSLISGERTTFLAIGTVDGVVDFSDVGADRVRVSADRRSVTITLPPPVQEPAVVDPAQSRVVGRERGILDRIGDALDDSPTVEQELYVLAGQKLDEAARVSDLAPRAEQSTRDMLTALAASFGFEQVTVTFDADDRR